MVVPKIGFLRWMINLTAKLNNEGAGKYMSTYKITRATSPELEQILGVPFKVLDKGFIRVIDFMGNDAAITQAARVSYGDGTKSINDDAGLINRLMRDRHTSPFEMNEIKLHIKMPIFIARQWIRHRTASLNEYSARYSVVKDEFYVPDMENIKGQSSTNKQGSDGQIESNDATLWRKNLDVSNSIDYSLYESAIGRGISRETARIGLPINTYTEMYWKIDLHNLLHFLGLRIDSHAQYEIRAYAQVIADMVKVWCPLAWNAFEEYRLYSVTFSRKELKTIKEYGYNRNNLPSEDHPFVKATGFSKGEWREFLLKVGN